VIRRAALLIALNGVLFGPIEAISAEISPLVTDGAQYLAVDWQETKKDGRTLVTGTVRNTSDWGAKRIQLLVEGLDASGQVVNQRVVCLGTDLPSGQHVYFEARAIEGAAGHRVRVFAFDWGKRG
jgi:hypothetical protein